MLTQEERALLTDIQDRLLELYVLRERAGRERDRERLASIESEIAEVEAQREQIRQLDTVGSAYGGGTPMTRNSAKTQRRHVREKSVVDHVARKLFEPRREPAGETGADRPNSTTDTGLSVEDQIRKEWGPHNGGLPTFLR